MKRGIVDSISVSQINRYLAEAALQPHRVKYWLNTTEKDRIVFEQQVQTAKESEKRPATWEEKWVSRRETGGNLALVAG